jgi:hypothetical protein
MEQKGAAPRLAARVQANENNNKSATERSMYSDSVFCDDFLSPSALLVGFWSGPNSSIGTTQANTARIGIN